MPETLKIGIPTADEEKLARPGQPEYGINRLSGGRLTTLGGGVPIIYKKKVVGAVGCSSETVDQDATVAKAGVVALLKNLR